MMTRVPITASRQGEIVGRRRVSDAAAVAGGAAAGLVLGALRGGSELTSTIPMGIFFAVLSAAVVYDLRERRIPNALTYPGIGVAIGWAASLGAAVDSLAGLVLAGGIMAAFWLPRGGRLGLGDVKFSAFVGSALGVRGVSTYLLTGTVLGAVAAMLMLTVFKRDAAQAMPYGPWLALGAAVAATRSGLLVV